MNEYVVVRISRQNIAERIARAAEPRRARQVRRVRRATRRAI